MGKKIEPVVVDGASNWPLFAEKAKQLLEQDKVAVTFGCWTSVSRKSVLPVSRRRRACSSIRSSTRARKCRRTSSTPRKP
jgi:ABC-type branched-subunit amino acid transport system substrate-binding protein